MGKSFQFFKSILLLVIMALLFVGCSEKEVKGTSDLTKFSDQQFKSFSQDFAQKLFDKNYAGAYPFFSKDLQNRMTVQQLQTGYEQLLQNSEFKKFSLQKTDNYNLIYEKQGGGMTLGTGERIADFDTVGAQVILNESNDEGWEDYTAYYIDFTVEDGVLKISEIDFFGHH